MILLSAHDRCMPGELRRTAKLRLRPFPPFCLFDLNDEYLNGSNVLKTGNLVTLNYSEVEFQAAEEKRVHGHGADQGDWGTMG
jgi:hypothetical protein